VDKHIRKLDSDLARFESEIQDKAISATRNIEENSQKRKYRTGCGLVIFNAGIMYVLLQEDVKRSKIKKLKRKAYPAKRKRPPNRQKRNN